MTCPNCAYPYTPAKSKRLQTCPNCTHKAETGEYLTGVKRRKAKESLERSRKRSAEKQKLKLPKPNKIRKQSQKGAKQARDVSATKKELKRAAIETGFGECEGCGNFFDTLDCSHKTPLSKNTELAADSDNIRLLCRECHNKFENGTAGEMVELKCFVEDMRYLFDNDNERFWQKFHRLLDFHLKTPTVKVWRAIEKIERFKTD